jgi:phage FluMu protein Com
MKEWRCIRCNKLLAVIDGDRLHIRFARGHEYLVGYPVTSVCRSCRTLNELRDGNSIAAPSKGSASTNAI